MIKNKKIISLIMSSLLIFSMTGCQSKEENEVVDNKILQEEYIDEQEAILKLEEEYIAMLDLMDDVFKATTLDDNLSISEAIDILNYIKKNRITPTQELTIKLNNTIDKLIEEGIKYVLASETDKAEFEERLYELLIEADVICKQIENKLNNSAIELI